MKGLIWKTVKINLTMVFRILFVVLLIGYSSSTFAQLEKKYNSKNQELPDWVQMMYSEDADIGKVIEAYEAYYKSNPFIKNGHTQYYKRWLRSIKRDPNGYVSGTNDWNNAQKLNQKYQEKVLSKAPSSPWTCIGPFDFDKGAADRSYAAGAAHIYTVEQSISNTNTLYAGTATAGIWKSIDKGANWTLLSHNLLVSDVKALEIDHSDENTVYFEGAGILYKTTDGGSTWNPIGDATFQSSAHQITDIVMHPTNNQIIFLCAEDGLYRTVDAGVNFTRIKGGEYQELEFHPTNNNILYAIKETGNRTEFYKSTDGGNTFILTGTGWPGIGSTSSVSFSSVNMDANGDYFSTATNPQFGSATLTDFTIEMRIKTPSWSGDPAFFSNKNWNNGGNKGMVLAGRGNGSGWKFNIGDGTNRIDINGGTINDNEWHHIAVTYDADGTKSVYQDGTLINTDNTIISTATDNAHALALGQDGTLTYGDHFNGDINEIRIWNMVLTQTDIDNWKCQIVDNTHPQYAALINHWKTDEGTGTTLTDNVSSNTLTASGTTTWNTSGTMTCVTPDLIAPDEQRRTEIATTPANPSKVYALCTGSANGGSGLYGIYVSNDEGATWTRTCCGPQPAGVPDAATNKNLMGWDDQGGDNGGQYYYDLAFDVSDSNENDLFVGGVNLWISNDGGNTFTCPSKWSHSYKPNYVHADIHDIRFFGSDLWVANDGGIFYSNDNGTTFNRKMLGIAGTDFWGFDAGFWDGDVMVGGTYHNGTLLKDNNVYDNGWISTGGGDNTLGKVNYANERKVYYDYGERMLSGDRTISNSGLPFNKDLWSKPFAFDPRSANMIYVGVEDANEDTKELWLTQDDGVTFSFIHAFNIPIHKIETAWNDPNVIYVSLSGGWWDRKEVWKTTDGGASWAEITPTLAELGSRDWVRYDITVDAQDANIVWLGRKYPYSGDALNGYQVLKSTDGGATWNSISTTMLDGESVTNIVHQRGTDGGVYIGTKRAVYYRNNSMADWALFNNNLPASTYSTDLIPFYKEGKIRNGTSRSVYEVEFYEPSQPVAQISVDRFTAYCSQDTLYFSDHSSLNQNGATWAWSFPGGNPTSSTERQPKVTYSAAGTYSVSLTVNNANGSNSQTLNNLITIENACEIDTIPQYALNPNTTGYLNLGRPQALNFTGNDPYTFSAWVKPNADNMTGYILTKYDRHVVGQYQFGIENGRLYASRETSPWSITGSTDLLGGIWYHVAATYDGSQLKIYVNGRLDGTINIGSISGIGRDVLVGARYRNGSVNDIFGGTIDELCVWNKALTQEEIRDTRHLTKYADENNLIAYFQFNEDMADSKVPDRIKSNHGTLGGDASRIISSAPVGGGSSHRLTVSSAGNYDFAQADVNINFSDPHPNGEVVVSRINLNPDQLPNAFPESRSYWVINNYGNNASFSELSQIDFKKIGVVSSADVSTPNTFKLYKRNSNDDGATWGTSIDDGDAAVSGGDGDVTFSTNNNIISFSQFIITNEGGSSLPVEFLSFTAHVKNKTEVVLDWATATEINNDKFIIERSQDGSRFEKIGEVVAIGNSETTHHYSFLDKNPYKGKSYYRIMQVDKDLSFDYSEIRSVFIRHSLAHGITIYPNPAQQQSGIKIATQHDIPGQFILFDASGKKVSTHFVEGELFLDTSSLAKGTYMYRFRSDTIMYNGILVIQ